MFSKTDKINDSDKVAAKAPSSLATRPVPKDTGPSLVSANLRIAGNLTTDGELQIDGVVEGNVNCTRLTVGEPGVISGEIEADEVEVRGKVDGRISARSVHLTKTAQIVGDVWHSSISMESGAFLDGHLRRNDSKTEKTTIQPPDQTESGSA